MRQRIGGDDQRGVDFAPGEQSPRGRFAGQVLRVAAREAHRRGKARLPGEHLRGADGVGRGAQRDRHRTRVAVQVSHELDDRLPRCVGRVNVAEIAGAGTPRLAAS